MARLVANIPVLEKGFLPVLIPLEKRLAYIEALAAWQIASGRVTPETPLEGDVYALSDFRALCTNTFESSQAMLAEAIVQQKARSQKK
jgi:hypothetical protein